MIFYLKWQLVLAAAGLGSAVWVTCLRRVPSLMGSRAALRLLYAVWLVALVAPLWLSLLPTPSFGRNAAQIWSSGSGTATESAGAAISFAPAGRSTTANRSPSIPLKGFEFGLAGLVLCGFLLRGVGLMREWRGLRKLCRTSVSLRKIGRVELFVSEDIIVPFAWASLGRRDVFLPMGLVVSSRAMRIAIAHELQHHRQGDTLAVYLLQVLEGLSYWNPLLRLGGRAIAELQEWACDEALVRERRFDAQVYARCLFETAKSASDGLSFTRLGTSGFTGRASGAQLKRRIENMMELKRRKVRVLPGFLAATVLFGALAAAAAVGQGSVVDRRIPMDRARTLAARAATPEFPIEMNEEILVRLNRTAGTPEGRKFFREALERMKEFEPTIDEALALYGYPTELKALPIIESGYRNLPPERNPLMCASLWQIIPSTGRRLGLRVDEEVDERMDVKLSTDAALRYLGALKLQFRDWRLAIMGYNSGEGLVEKGIIKTKSRDPWKLIRSGFENDSEYFAKFTAALIVMKNPEILAD